MRSLVSRFSCAAVAAFLLAVALSPAPLKAVQALPDAAANLAAEAKYWLNTDSGIRHNSKCKSFNNTKKGRFCGPSEGKACKNCGG